MKTMLVVLAAMCHSLFVQAQTNYLLTATVVDEQQQPLYGAAVLINNGQKSAVTNSKGVFSVEYSGSTLCSLEINHIGYKPHKEIVDPKVPLPLLIVLQPLVEMLHEVTVTDNLALRRQRENAQAVEVATDTYLRANLSGSIMATLERLPGVGALTIGSGQSKPMIRGLGFNRVVVVENGIKHEGQQWGADHGLEIDQHGVEHVEIVKGPASILYGPDAIGGVVDLGHDRIPAPRSVAGAVDLFAQSNNQLWGTSAHINARGDKLFFKTRFTITDYADYRVPTNSATIYSYSVPLHEQRLRNTAGNEQSLTVTGGWALRRFNNRTTVSRISQRAGFFANAHGRVLRNVDAAGFDRSDRDIMDPLQEVVHVKATNRTLFLSETFKFESEIGFQNNYRQEWGPYTPHGYMPTDGHTISGVPQNLERQFDKNTYSANLKTTVDKWEGHTVTGGVQTEKQNNRISGWSFIIPEFEQWTGGIFVYDKIRLSDQWTLHSAVRGDMGNIQIKAYNDWFQTPVSTDGSTDTQPTYLERAPNADLTFKSVVWSVGTVYDTQPLLLKANVGKSFRMPTAKELAANGVNYHYFSYERGYLNLKPEVSYQLDLNAEINRRQWAVQISPFFNYFPNYIYLNPTPLHDHLHGAGNQIFDYTQAQVVRHGMELHTHYRFTAWIKAGIVGEWVSHTQTDGDKKGYTLPFSPPPSVILNLKADTPNGKQIKEGYLSADLKLVGDQNRIVPPEKPTPGYATVNLMAGADIRVGNQWLTINAQVHNLFDTKYYNHTSFYRLIDLPEAGRNFIVNVTVPFSITNNGH